MRYNYEVCPIMYHNNNGGNDLKDKQRHYKKYLNLRTMIAESAEKFGDKTYLRYFDNDKNICDLSFADFAKGCFSCHLLSLS